MGPFDITFTFAKAGDFSGQAMVVDHASVTMSPQHFKAFCRSMAESLKGYESVFGVIPIADSDAAPLHKAEQIEKLLQDTREKGAAARENLAATNMAIAERPSSTAKKQPSKRSRGGAPESGR
jgi:hypothetical protein